MTSERKARVQEGERNSRRDVGPETDGREEAGGASKEFEVNIGLRQGSVLSPLLFIAVVNLISRKTVVNNAMKKLLYADDLALVANGKQELQDTLEEWNGLFTRHRLNINQREELDIDLEDKKLTQGDSFVYLGGGSVRRRENEKEVRRRVHDGAKAWRAGEGVMADRRISKRLKGKVRARVSHRHACTEWKP